MKRGLCIVGFLVLAAQIPLWGYDTSPNTWQVVPEAIWAAATGGGTWVTELQITNMGPSETTIMVYFDTSTEHGSMLALPGTLAPFKSVKYPNILATLDSIDSSARVYFGLVGALGVYTSEVLIQVQAQTVNGNYGKTFPGLNVVEGNVVAGGSPMMIQGLVRNAAYRTSIGIYNTSPAACSVRFTIYDAAYSVVGASFDKTLGGLGFASFNPFVQAGATTGDYDNCWLYVEFLSGGSEDYKPILYGSIANNYTNDTYALLAKSYSTSYNFETSPTAIKTVPEVIWAPATGGGTWVTEVQVTNLGPTTTGLEVYFDSPGAWSGEIQLHPGLEKDHSVTYSNILATIDALDPGSIVYYGRVGALFILATDQTCRIQVQAKTVNGNYGKTFPGLTYNITGTTAGQDRPMMIQGLVKNSTYRTSVGVHNTSSNYSYVARFTIFDGDHAVVGSSFQKTIGINGFQSFNPFTQAGVTTGDYDNCWLYIEVLSGGSSPQALMCYGSLANNYTNDTYALLAKQYGGYAVPPAPPVRY
jgi:hypothetical protein